MPSPKETGCTNRNTTVKNEGVLNSYRVVAGVHRRLQKSRNRSKSSTHGNRNPTEPKAGFGMPRLRDHLSCWAVHETEATETLQALIKLPKGKWLWACFSVSIGDGNSTNRNITVKNEGVLTAVGLQLELAADLKRVEIRSESSKNGTQSHWAKSQ